jgi:SAM-dependent methyltransferase
MEPELDADIRAYYDEAGEDVRLGEKNRLELLRTQELLLRVLPPAPATVVDVGGGPGVYSAWLQELGHDVVLVDPVPLHLDQARGRGVRAARLGDARALDLPDRSADAVLLMGPLYHLVDRADRLQAWREAARVVRPDGVVVAAVISRFAAVLDGVARELSLREGFRAQALRSVGTGVLSPQAGGGFTTAFFHRPEEIPAEIADAGLVHEVTWGVEGPGGWMPDLDERLDDDARRTIVVELARTVETEASVLGASAHLLVVARPS